MSLNSYVWEEKGFLCAKRRPTLPSRWRHLCPEARVNSGWPLDLQVFIKHVQQGVLPCSARSWSVCALRFMFFLFFRSAGETPGRGGVFGAPAAPSKPRHGIVTFLSWLVKGFFRPDQYTNWAVWSSIFQAFIQTRATNTIYTEVRKPESELCKSGTTSFK